MRKITDSKELRQIQMNMLDYIDELCLHNDIKYSICGGTLIGAIRHKGYIPWDDDIDIMLTRDQYDKLITAISIDSSEHSVYSILTHTLDNNFKYPYAKIVDNRTIMHESIKGCKDYGVYLDIFPVDRVPDDDKALKKMLSDMKRFFNMLVIKRLKLSPNRTLWKNITIIFSQIALFPISNDWIIRKMEALAQKYRGENTSRCGILVWGYGKKEIIPASVHETHTYLQFEDRRYKAVSDYHTYLKNVYGDYMQLPPENKRITHHDFLAWWR